MGYAGQIYYSGDAVTWAWVPPVTTVELRAVIWTRTHFFAVGGTPCSSVDATGAVLTTSDGITWRSAVVPPAQGALNDIAWNGSLYVATECGRYFASSDLVTLDTYLGPLTSGRASGPRGYRARDGSIAWHARRDRHARHACGMTNSR